MSGILNHIVQYTEASAAQGGRRLARSSGAHTLPHDEEIARRSRRHRDGDMRRHGSGSRDAHVPFSGHWRLTREVPGLLQVSGVPGLSMAVVRAGQVVWSGAFGTVNDSAKRPLDAGTVFEAASLSKPVFAYLVLRLADRRRARPRPAAARHARVSPARPGPRVPETSRPERFSHTPPGSQIGAATRFVSGSPRARTTGIPAKASSFSRRRSSGSPDDPRRARGA